MVHRVARSILVPLIFSTYKEFMKYWKVVIYTKTILADLEVGVRTLFGLHVLI